MEFITGTCPKCQGELQIPEGHEKIICMYCGAEINIKEAVGITDRVPLSPEETARYQEYAKKAIEQFPQMLFQIKDPLKDFKKNMYESRFCAYEQEQEAVMDLIEDAYMAAEDPQAFLTELAENFVTKVEENLEEKKGKRRKEDAVLNFSMCLVIYVNPALLDHNKASGRVAAEELLRCWKIHFPKTNLKVADFATINSGFKRRFCYITTAVCQSLGKPDDCYELELLREYRDNYLRKQEGGEQSIQYYYDIAPTIVKHINKTKEADKIYAGIWQDYLSPCIRFIEKQEHETCRETYREMVDMLAKMYFYQEE